MHVQKTNAFKILIRMQEKPSAYCASSWTVNNDLPRKDKQGQEKPEVVAFFLSTSLLVRLQIFNQAAQLTHLTHFIFIFKNSQSTVQQITNLSTRESAADQYLWEHS